MKTRPHWAAVAGVGFNQSVSMSRFIAHVTVGFEFMSPLNISLRSHKNLCKVHSIRRVRRNFSQLQA